MATTSKTLLPPKPGFMARRWRVVLAVVMGLASLIPIRIAALPPGLSGLMCWDMAALAFLMPTLWMIWRDDETIVRRRAAEEDESGPVTLIIVLSAVIASLAGAVLAMHEAKARAPHGPDVRSWAWIFAIATVLVGWILVQTVFTLHYAHRYFGDGDKDGEMDGGVKFPGDAPNSYHDFVYMAVCIGASAQVSDFDITNARFRRLVTAHSILAFFFNSMVLALGINILATIIGQ